MKTTRASVIRSIAFLALVLLGACRADMLAPRVPTAPRLSILPPDVGVLWVTMDTNPQASATLTTYPYRTAIAMHLAGNISMTSNNGYYSLYSGPLDGRGVRSGDFCYAYVRVTYNALDHGPSDYCVESPSPPPYGVWEDTAIVSAQGRIYRMAGVPLAASEGPSPGTCNIGRQTEGPCYHYSGSQDYVVGRIPATLTLTGLAAVTPNTYDTVTGPVLPQWVHNLKIPFAVETWLWVPAGVPPYFIAPPPVVNPTGCSPPAEDTNPAVCSLKPATSGRVEINAIVNGVPQTLRKNIGAVDNARICSSPPLKDFWYVTTQFGQIDASHPKKPHTGRDQAGPGVRGTPVYSVEGGTVVYADSAEGAGWMVVVSGGTATSYYMHMDPLAPGLHDGQPVAAGQLLGYVGSTGGVACSPNNPGCDPAHLHFEQHKPGPPPYFAPANGHNLPPPGNLIEPCFF